MRILKNLMIYNLDSILLSELKISNEQIKPEKIVMTLSKNEVSALVGEND